ncbi:uncharacterized protein LACBIDRAFT_322722 [Laccaria bicolor S238N-H82]|uniref:Predicted protein n=1 Tax=Laccaria bicolor (strain S238N-H82 / ATCC MYA-4686) TaxID=486041 RepID=B0CXA5_LACBS|nr:uncharacterized protein LACBIDRAFT_322722 [Laccaria bicolor S238N-H82]EDR13221.1 predicted protein [Laccaria bicolor S238N-H82]|eukprot:XP_001875719.1 predicted protein [Laccaria bicolor S238N-H82]
MLSNGFPSPYFVGNFNQPGVFHDYYPLLFEKSVVRTVHHSLKTLEDFHIRNFVRTFMLSNGFPSPYFVEIFGQPSRSTLITLRMSGIHVDFEPEAAWKRALQSQIKDNLKKMLEDARTSYEFQIANVQRTCEEKRSELMAEYFSYVEFLQASAGAEYEDAIKRERGGRERVVQCGVMPEEWSSALQEQKDILEAIERKKGTPFGVGRPSRETTIPDEVERSTTSIPSTQPTSHNAASSTWTDTGILDGQPLQMPEEAAARERREEHERQQEEFRKCADGPLSDEDAIKLLLFHDQQWSYVAEYTSLRWYDIPWPVLRVAVRSPDDLTLDAVSAYIMLGFDLRRDKARLKQRLREHIKKWHPDRFEGRYLKKVPDGWERERVGRGAAMVARILIDLLREIV